MKKTLVAPTAPNIGLSEDSRACIAGILQPLLADEHVLYIKTRKSHWNVTGPHFHHLHEFFEAQYHLLEAIIDEIAERSLKIGFKVPATLVEFSKLARLTEAPGDNLSATEMIQALLADHEAIIRQLRKDLDRADEKYNDVGTSDFLTGLMEQHEKMAWMLRSSLD